MASAASLMHNLSHSTEPTENATTGVNSKQPTKRKFDDQFQTESEQFQAKEGLASQPVGRVLVQLRSESGIALDAPLDLELSVTPDKLQTLVHALLQQV